MRIGFDAKRAFRNKAGLGNYSRTLLNLFSQGLTNSELFLYTPKLSEIAFAARKTSRIETPRGLYKKLPSIWRSYGLTRRLVNDNVAVFHGMAGELPNGIHKTGIKTIVTIHDLIFLRYPQWYKPIDRYIYNRKYKKAAQIADKVVAISEQTKADLVDFYQIPEQKITVIYQGCNPIFYKPVPTEKIAEVKALRHLPNTFILFVSTVEPRKNLLNIFKGLKAENLEIPVAVVGGMSSHAHEIKTWLTENQMEHLALWQSYVPNDQLPALYASASVFVYPSIFEGFGIPILEALNAGTPVITSKGSCFAEPGGKKSLYVNPTDPSEIGAAIRRVLSEPNLRAEMVTAGKQHALRFRESEIMSDWKQLLNDL